VAVILLKHRDDQAIPAAKVFEAVMPSLEEFQADIRHTYGRAPRSRDGLHALALFGSGARMGRGLGK